MVTFLLQTMNALYLPLQEVCLQCHVSCVLGRSILIQCTQGNIYRESVLSLIPNQFPMSKVTKRNTTEISRYTYIYIYIYIEDRKEIYNYNWYTVDELRHTMGRFHIRCFTSIWNPITKRRRSTSCIIVILGLLILVRRRLYIESAHRSRLL